MLTPNMNTSASTAAQGLWLIGCGSGFIVQEKRLLGGDDTIEEVVVLSHHVLHLWIIARPPLSSKSVNYDAQLYLSERQLLSFHSEIGNMLRCVWCSRSRADTALAPTQGE